MTEAIEINVINSVMVFAAAVIPLYLSFQIKGKLRILTILLTAFAIVHAIYHAIEIFGYEEVGEVIVEPLSVIILIAFGLAYMRMIRVRRIQA